jgi:hypothetical protein
MKTKELKNLAKKIAKLEKSLKIASGKDKRAIEEEIVKLSSKVDNFEDIIILDEMIMELLEENV